MQTSKEKIDALLGISADQSVDDYLDQLSMQGDFNALSTAFDNVKVEVQNNIQQIDDAYMKPMTTLQLSTMENSLHEVEDLVALSKSMFKHVYEQIVTTTLLDAEAINAAAKLLESVHINIAEFITLYKSRQQFLDKLTLMDKAYQYDIMKMDHKHQLELEKMSKKLDMSSIPAEEGKIDADFDNIITTLSKIDNED